jgi:hypothetical protein
MPFDALRLALDKSMRRYDEDGRLHVEVSHLTKAAVNPYRGNEIPGWQELRLDPDRIYYLLRHPGELEKAVPTFNNIQLLDQHIPITAADAQQPRVVGSTGTDATWNAPYIDNSLVFWTDAAKAMIESGDQRELSAAYRYDPVMKPGVYMGRKYDGVMTNIRANHVALVDAGRAGSDVVVMDSKLKEIEMPMTALGAYLAGSATAYIRPLLAQDSKFQVTREIAPLFKGVTAKNWKSKRPAIEAAMARLTKPHLAADAEIHIHEHMDGAAGDPGDPVEGEVIKPLDEEPGTGVAETPVTAKDDDLAQTVQQLLTGKIDDEDLAMIMHALQNMEPPPPKPEPEDNGNGNGNGSPPETEDDAEAIENLGLNPKPGMAGDRKPAMDRKMQVAMDEAVRRAVAATTERLNARDEARDFVRAWVGPVAVAMDSAEEIYKFALETLGLDSNVHPSAYKAILAMAPKPGDSQPRKTIAMDAGGNKKYLERFPNAGRLSTRH